MLNIIPSLPAANFNELESLVFKLIDEIDEIQVDIVDGQFVNSVSWPFTEAAPTVEILKLSILPKKLAIEVDCMVMKPEQYFEIFYKLGIKKVVLHYGSTPDLKLAIDQLKEKGVLVGLAFTNDIAFGHIEPYMDVIDYVQVMGIATVGQQGQPFDERTLTTVKFLRGKYPNLTIAVDGSVNENTIVALRDVGVDRFMPGSAIAKAIDSKSSLNNLRLLVATH